MADATLPKLDIRLYFASTCLFLEISRMNYILLAALVVEVAVMSGLENRLTGTRITPFGVLAFPYTIVVLLAFALGPLLDFVPLNTGSLTVWMWGLFLVWMMGYLLARIVLGGPLFRGTARGFRAQFQGEVFSTKMSMSLATLSIPILILGVFLSVRAVGGWSGITSPEFKAAHAHGLHADALLLCEPLFILLVGTAKRKSRFQIALAGILMVFFLIGQVKGRVFQDLIGGFLYRVMRGRSFVSVKSVGILMFCVFFVFCSIYLGARWVWDPGAVSDSGTYVFIARHFSSYLLSGVLGFSEAYRTGTSDVGGGSSTEIFRPFVDIYRRLFDAGHEVGLGSTMEKGMAIDLTDDSVDSSTNVYTLFGTLYLYLGALGFAAYVTVMALLCYALFLAAGWTRNEWVLVLYCYIGAQLLFGYFEFYFWHVDTYKIAICTLTFAAFSSSFKKSFQPRFSVDTSYASYFKKRLAILEMISLPKRRK